jgi:hypothetical protein
LGKGGRAEHFVDLKNRFDRHIYGHVVFGDRQDAERFSLVRRIQHQGNFELVYFLLLYVSYVLVNA